ncbi:MAG: CBS domain-containing protein [Candidatus Lambdaproteobacteria bacterium]|nr:CBS domain-containing protein [Candidatus Lambdaproteobacteria bacterium]
MNSILQYSVSDIMTKSPITVAPGTLLSVLIEEFDRTDFNGYPVLDNGRLLGIVTQYDVLKAFIFHPNEIIPQYARIMQKTVGEIFSTNAQQVVSTTPVTEAIQMLVDSRHHGLLVTDERGKLVGIVTRYDIARCLRAAFK